MTVKSKPRKDGGMNIYVKPENDDRYTVVVKNDGEEVYNSYASKPFVIKFEASK